MNARSVLWFPVLVAVMIQAIFVVRGVTPVLDGGLYGPDAYMRLVRVGELVEHGRWFDATSVRSNAPFGETLHWTRPLDVLLLAGALPLSAFLGFERALYWWGVMLSPLLQIAALAALVWAGRPLFEGRARVLLAVVFLCQPGVFYAFMAGRPDHHGLLAVLFVLTVGFTLRLIGEGRRGGHCVGAGAVAALATWVSVEALVSVALMLAALGLFWIRRGGDYAEKGRLVALTLAAGTALALVLDPPGRGVLAEVHDRLSVVHVVLLALVALTWSAVEAVERRVAAARGARRRLVLGGGGAALALVVAWLAFPKLLGGPYVDVDPRVLPIYLALVDEVQPLLRAGRPWLNDVLFWLGAALPGVPYLAYRCLRGGSGERPYWLFLLGAVLLFVPLTFYQLRWSSYAGMLLVFPVTGLLVRVLEVLDRRLALPWRAAARAFAVLLFSVGFLVLGIVLQRGSEQFASAEAMQEAARKCSLKRFAAFAERDAAQAPERILANLFSGPELLYRMGHEVIATPYHRNAAGIGDAHAMLAADSEAVARPLIAVRGVTWILLCPGSAEPRLYRRPGATFYERLAGGEAPAWLRPVALPPGLEGFRLFEVRD